MRSCISAALCLSLIATCSARIPHSYKQLAHRDPDPKPSNLIVRLFNKLFKRDLEVRQSSSNSSNGTCYQDDYYYFVYNSTFGEKVCQMFIDYPNVTTTYDYTPVRYDCDQHM